MDKYAKVEKFNDFFQIALVGLCSRDLFPDLIVKKASEIALLATAEAESVSNKISWEEENPQV